MAYSEHEIRRDIKAHIEKEGSTFSTWYAGITDDIDRRLFGEHCVDRLNGWYIYRAAASAEVARRVEEFFHGLGCDGEKGGGGPDSKIVYAYKKTATTSP